MTELDDLKDTLAQLQHFLRDCKPTMELPVEQGIRANVVGTKLNNTYGSMVSAAAILQGEQELVVVLLDETPDHFTINLADLLALARMAVVPEEA